LGFFHIFHISLFFPYCPYLITIQLGYFHIFHSHTSRGPTKKHRHLYKVQSFENNDSQWRPHVVEMHNLMLLITPFSIFKLV
jgi:hypothetical protein